MIAKKVLITGATGFVGANLTRRLLTDGHRVHLLLRKGYSPWRIREIRKVVHLHSVGLNNRRSLIKLVRRIKPEWIFHLAAYGGYSWQTGINKIVQTNLKGTINLLEACLQVGFETFVNTGSSSEYGFKSHAPSEKEMLEPNSDYAITKAAASHYCRLKAQQRKAYIPTLRLYSVYGSFEEPKRLMPTLVLKGLENKLPQLAQPRISRDFVYIDDVCEAFILSAANRGRELGPIYNVGTDVQTSLRELVTLAGKVFKIKERPSWSSMPNRQWDTSSWVADSRKIRRNLGWKPRVSLKRGLEKMSSWFEENPEWKRYYSKRIA